MWNYKKIVKGHQEGLSSEKQDAIVLVMKDYRALGNLSKNYRDNKYIVELAIAHNYKALEFAPKAYLIDQEFLLKSVVTQPAILSLCSKDLCDNDAFMFEAVNQNGLSFAFASERLRGNVELARKAYNEELIAETFFIPKYDQPDLVGIKKAKQMTKKERQAYLKENGTAEMTRELIVRFQKCNDEELIQEYNRLVGRFLPIYRAWCTSIYVSKEIENRFDIVNNMSFFWRHGKRLALAKGWLSFELV